jgi:serine phosphatase RsbU (regulator of sigma subunit)
MRRSNSPLVRYGVGVLGTALAFLLVLPVNALLRPDFPGHIASPLFLLAVVVGAWYGGKGPGLITAALSYLTLDYFFLVPIYAFSPGLEDIPTATVYLLAALVVGVLEERRQRAEQTLRRSEERMLIARAIQTHLLPLAPPDLPGFEIAGASRLAEATGGDFFDFIPMRGGRMGIVVGDVSGHGFPSALVMAETRACLRTLALAHDSVGEILTRANAMLVEDTDDELFVTLFMACIHPARRSLVYAAAGHEACLLRGTGRRDRLGSTSLPLGVAKVVVPEASGLSLEDGDMLLLFTDGILEARSRRGEQFGFNRTIEAIWANRTASAREMVAYLAETVQVFSSRMAQEDDMTAVVIKVNGHAIQCGEPVASRGLQLPNGEAFEVTEAT